MQNKILACLLISTYCLLAINGDRVPVLSYFGSNNLVDSITVGKVLSSSEFLNQVKDLLKPNLDIILVDKLNTQDISLLQKKFDLTNAVLEPQVESPFQTLDTYVKEKNINVNVLKFQDVVEALTMFNKLHQKANVILTGLQEHRLDSASSRSKRAAKLDNQQEELRNGNSTTYVFGTQCAAFFDKVYLVDQTSTESKQIYLPISNSTNSFDCANENLTQTFSIGFEKNNGTSGVSINTLNLIFKKSNSTGYYVLDNANVVFDDKSNYSLIYMGYPYGMETPLGFSFVCTRTVFKANNISTEKASPKIWFYIENLQLQPIGVFPNGSNYTFGIVNYCQGFFSSGIWMAITSSIILTFILAFGVSLLFNVKTMDRFDDPKGKPLNIGAEK